MNQNISMRGQLQTNQIFLEAVISVASGLGGSGSGRAIDPVQVARSVQAISDFYLKNPSGKTPYESPGAVQAYLLYFTFLNHVRCLSVFDHGRGLGFFSGLDRVIDWGSGMGAAWFALWDSLRNDDQEKTETGQDSHFRERCLFQESLIIERSEAAIAAQHELRRLIYPDLSRTRHRAARSDRDVGEFLASKEDAARTVAVFSYSLTELAELPRWAFECEGLAIIEPGTHQDGRRLMAIRSELIAKGYELWAPCTHHGECPLLVNSKTDWCHDRIDWQQPAVYREIEQHLPMRHKTLVYSYLLARKTLKAPSVLRGAARLTGDQQRQKGQTRQMFCRSSDREFLSWQHRHGEPPEFPRGELVRVPDTAEKKGTDCRVTPEDVLRVRLDPESPETVETGS